MHTAIVLILSAGVFICTWMSLKVMQVSANYGTHTSAGTWAPPSCKGENLILINRR